MKITVGIPFFNPGDIFAESIQSVLEQTHQHLEIILLDDGSSDGSLAIAKSFNDPRIKVISDGKNLRLPKRLNQLIDLATGDFIARMDADDIIAPTKFAQQLAMLQANEKIDLVATGMCSITNDNQVIGYRLPAEKQRINNTVADAIFGRVNIAHATILARRSWCLRNRYNENARLMEDYQLWIDAAVNNDLNVGYIQAPLYFYREESSVSPQKAINAYKNQFNVFWTNYFKHLSLIDKIRFSLQTLIKISVVFCLNFIGRSDNLLKIRNKSTTQDLTTLKQLQQELDSIRKTCE